MARRINLSAALLASLLISAAQAATFNVTSTADSGTGSLRSAIAGANVVPNTPHTIAFNTQFPDGGTINLQSALPLIQVQNLAIAGGTRSPIISGVNAHQILRVGSASTSLTISDVEFRLGRSLSRGGCIDDAAFGSTAGVLSLTRTVFSDCIVSAATNAEGGAVFWQRNGGSLEIAASRFSSNGALATLANGLSAGAAIYAQSNVTITNSQFEFNVAESLGSSGGGSGGALHVVNNGQSTDISDSTFYFNSVDGLGGAIFRSCGTCSTEIVRSYLRGNEARFGGAVFARSESNSVDPIVNFFNSSFVGNSASESGGAVLIFGIELLLASSTFFNNESDIGAHIAFGGDENSVVYALGNLFAPTFTGLACSGSASRPNPSLIAANLFSDNSCGQISANSLPNSPLGTVTLDETPGQVGVVRFTGSAVIDSISSNAQCEPRDARFQQRPIDGNGDGIARCDVGAFEHPNTTIFRNGFEN